MAISDYEDLTSYYLDDDRLDELVNTARECVLNWTTSDGWPVGVIHSFVPGAEGRIWLTCAHRRKRVAAIKRDDRVSVVITSTGTKMGPGKTVTFKGHCRIHEPGQDTFDEVKNWFYPALSARVRPDSEDAQRIFTAFLDSPGRVILEVTPVWKLTYDGEKMGRATVEATGQRVI